MKEKMFEQDREDEAVVGFLIAKSQAEAMQSYISRGRHLEDLSDTQLSEKFMEAMRIWASDPTDRARYVLRDEVHAEYRIRGCKPPLELATAEVDTIRAAVARMHAEVSEERKREIEADIYAEYERAKSERH